MRSDADAKVMAPAPAKVYTPGSMSQQATREVPRSVEPTLDAILDALGALETELRCTLRLGAQADRVRSIVRALTPPRVSRSSMECLEVPCAYFAGGELSIEPSSHDTLDVYAPGYALTPETARQVAQYMLAWATAEP